MDSGQPPLKTSPVEMAGPQTSGGKRPRPCDVCRRRKARCYTKPGERVCIMCDMRGLSSCTFDTTPSEMNGRRRRADLSAEGKSAAAAAAKRKRVASIRKVTPIEDYDSMPEASLLKTNFGLQQHVFSTCIASSAEVEPMCFAAAEYDARDECHLVGGDAVRRVTNDTSFLVRPYGGTFLRTEEINLLDAIEQAVSPHGRQLVDIFFTHTHPAYPILHRNVFLEKYARTHREFSPHCLCGVYVFGLRWLQHSARLAGEPVPENAELDRVARDVASTSTKLPKLSVLQGGLLMFQTLPMQSQGRWAQSCQIVGLCQELGLHLDCSDWRVPAWEKGMRKRIAWAAFMVDKWSSMIHGFPSHIVERDWLVAPLNDRDFLEAEDAESDVSLARDVRVGRHVFQSMVSLTRILGSITERFGFHEPDREFRDMTELLRAAKPYYGKLRGWYKSLAPYLKMENAKPDEPLSSSILALNLAYFAVELVLHRTVIKFLIRSYTNENTIDICRRSAGACVAGAVSYLARIERSQMEDFWCFSSSNLVTVGTFIALMFLTSQTLDEAVRYKGLLDEYRQVLASSQAHAPFVSAAITRLNSALTFVDRMDLESMFPPLVEDETEASMDTSSASGRESRQSFPEADSHSSLHMAPLPPAQMPIRGPPTPLMQSKGPGSFLAMTPEAVSQAQAHSPAVPFVEAEQDFDMYTLLESSSFQESLQQSTDRYTGLFMPWATEFTADSGTGYEDSASHHVRDLLFFD